MLQDEETSHSYTIPKYRIIVAGSRILRNYKDIKKELDEYLSQFPKDEVEIVSGCASGPDTYAIQYAYLNKYKLVEMPANWARFGKKAGPLRNTEMAEYATHCLAFLANGYKSRGTWDMINKAKEYGLELKVVEYDNGI